ncbi:MAG: hypothetical protein RDU41_06300 [Clostridia bacterium]|nr:hypothetical protein [Clostridia bacterium]
MKETKRSRLKTEEIGAISRSIFHRLADTEYLSTLRWPSCIPVYDKMRRSDGQVQALLHVLELPIRSTRWYVGPYSNSAKDKEIAEFVEENLFAGPPNGMTIHWDDFLRLALLMFPFGHSIFEKVYEVDAHGFAKWRKFAERPPETIRDFVYDETGGPLAVEQYGLGTAYVSIPIDDLLVFTHRREGGRLQGIPVLRAVYKHWFIKDFLYKILNIGIERNLVGTPVITLPETPGDDDKDEAEKIVTNLRSGEESGAVLPFGFELGLFEGKRAMKDEVLPYIQYQDLMIVRSGLAHFLQLGSGTTGSYALSEDQSDLFLMSLNASADYVMNTINSYAIPQLVDYNWDAEGYPTLAHEPVGGRGKQAIINGVRSLVGGKVILPDRELEEFMRELLGLPKIGKETRAGGPPAVPAMHEPG